MNEFMNLWIFHDKWCMILLDENDFLAFNALDTITVSQM